jgi:hypothetical protein
MASKSRVLRTAALSALQSVTRICPLAGCLIALPNLCHAANNCPWINETTASGLLGGDATGAYSLPSSSQAAVCTFVQISNEGTRTLRIAVEQTPDFLARLESEYKACGTDAVPLTAIGNEARMCNADDRKRLIAERVVGRVRDQVFTITLNTTRKSDGILTRGELKTRIYTAAEQVAGNLF